MLGFLRSMYPEICIKLELRDVTMSENVGLSWAFAIQHWEIISDLHVKVNYCSLH